VALVASVVVALAEEVQEEAGDILRQKAEGGRQKAEGGRQKAEGGRRKAEGGRRKTEGGRRKTEDERRKKRDIRKKKGRSERSEDSAKRKGVKGGRCNSMLLCVTFLIQFIKKGFFLGNVSSGDIISPFVNYLFHIIRQLRIEE